MASSQLVIEDFEGARTVVPLERDSLTIGRSAGHLIQLTEQNISRDHAKLYLHEEGWVIEDLGSYNGIQVNNVPIETPVILREGDLVVIGDYVMQIAADATRETVEILGAGAVMNSSLTQGQTMESSSALPKVPVSGPAASVSDRTGPAIAATAASPAAGFDDGLDEFDLEDESSSKKGVIIIALIVVVAGLGFWWKRGSSDADAGAAGAVASAGDAAKAKAAKMPSPTEEAPADAAAGEVPAGDDGTGTGEAKADDDGTAGADETTSAPEEAAPEEEATPPAAPTARKSTRKKSSAGTKTASAPAPAPEPEPEPEPAPAPAPEPVQTPAKTAAPTPPPATSSKTAEELLAEARKAAFSGKASTAYDLAKKSNAKSPSADAVQLMAVSACKMGSESKAKAAYNKLSDKKQKSVRSLCESKGISLD